MIVQKIVTTGFMGRPKGISLELPTRGGLVVLSGPNGSGKSSILEAVATALWGETLRGETPWRTGEPGSVRVFLHQPELRVARSTTKGGTKSVSTRLDSEGEQDWPTAGKAAAFIESRVGTFDVWRKVSVFSAEDVARFSSASDGERKRLLEEILGLDRFDDALVACRSQLADRKAEAQRLRMEEKQLEESERHRLQRVEDLEAQVRRLKSLTVEVTPESEIKAAQVELEQIRVRLKDALRLASEADQAVAARKAEQRIASDNVHACQAGKCPTCERSVPATLLSKLRAKMDEADRLVLEATAASRDVETRQLRLDESAAQDRVSRLKAHREAALSVEQRTQRELKDAEKQLEKVRSFDSSQLQQGADLDQAIAHVDQEVEVLAYAEVVLGLRGVRAQILGGTLRGIEQMANGHLAKIAQEPDFRIRLSASTELKSGKTIDTLSVSVEGVGGGHGYRACSTGQRRRIDVAIVLALARVAEFAHARVGGTLFLDEVFDGLDDYGTGAVVELLAEISATRPVVVVTHNQTLAARIKPKAAVVVDLGRVE